jgi:hypothetical protein
MAWQSSPRHDPTEGKRETLTGGAGIRCYVYVFEVRDKLGILIITRRNPYPDAQKGDLHEMHGVSTAENVANL